GVEVLAAAERDGARGAGVADHDLGLHVDLLVAAPDGGAAHAAILDLEGADLAAEPELAAARLDDVGEPLNESERALRAAAEVPERALPDEVGEEGLGGELVAVDGEDRRAEVAKDGVQRPVGCEALEPGLGREPILGHVAPTRAAQRVEQARAAPGDAGDEEPPAALRKCVVATRDAEERRGRRDADVPPRAD